MIKVIQLIQGKHFGGAEKVVFQISTHLSPPEFESEVICLSEGKLYTMLRQAGVKTHLVPMRSKLDFSVLGRLITLLKSNPGAIIQSHTGRTNLLARLASAVVNIKKLVTLHSPILYDTNVNLRPKRLNAIVERLTARWSDFFVTVSKEGYEHLLQQGIPAEKIMVIYNGIDCQRVTKLTPEEKNNLRQELGFSADTPIVAMVAQLRPRKGAEYLIRAIPAIHNAIPECRFLFVGDAEFVEGKDYLGELKHLAALTGVEHLLKFTGFRSDVDKILEIATVLVLPSLFGEGLPLVLLEGMAHNLPVVATNTAGNKEVVMDGETGYLVPPADSGLLADKIIKLLKSPELRQRLGEAGRHRVESVFSMETMLEKYKLVYRQLARNSSK